MSRLVIDASITANWLLGDEFDPRAAAAPDAKLARAAITEGLEVPSS